MQLLKIETTRHDYVSTAHTLVVFATKTFSLMGFLVLVPFFDYDPNFHS
jgi:hypothetical protein